MRNIKTYREMITESVELDEMLVVELSKGAPDKARVKELLDAGADPNSGLTRDGNMLPLGLATRRCNLSVISMLLDAGAEVNERDPNGNTAMWIAVRFGLVPEMKLFMSRGADTNVRFMSKPDGKTMLIYCILESRKESIDALIEGGVDVNGPTWDGYTPLTLAVKVGSYRSIDALVEAGADVDKPDDRGKTPMAYARELEEKKFIEGQTDFLVRRLILFGADPFTAFRDVDELERHFPETGQKPGMDWVPEGPIKDRLRRSRKSERLFGI